MSYDRRKVRVGRVISDKMDRTVVVQVEWSRRHRLYKKPVRRRSKLRVHDPENVSMVGDLVQVIESRPRSKTKRWSLAEVLQRSESAGVRPEEIVEALSEPVVESPEAQDAPQDEGIAEEVAAPAIVAEVESEQAAESEADVEVVTEEAVAGDVVAEVETAEVVVGDPVVEPAPDAAEVEVEAVTDGAAIAEDAVEADAAVTTEASSDVEMEAAAKVEDAQESAERGSKAP